jgi:hypothetical protein
MARRRLYPLAEDYSAQFTSPEDIVLTKLRWFVLGDRVSDKQWNNIAQVIETREATSTLSTRRWSNTFEVLPELESALQQAGRLDA